MKKLLSTLLAVLLAVTMLTGMAIPAQAAENDIFNPGVLELDGSRTFTINPKGTSLSKVTSPKKAQLKVTWKKQATQTTGYQVQYSTDKNFKKGNKTVTVKGAKTTAKTISKLTKGKKYYVRVRTYKTVNKTNFYSGWSKSSSVTVKK